MLLTHVTHPHTYKLSYAASHTYKKVTLLERIKQLVTNLHRSCTILTTYLQLIQVFKLS